MKTLLLICLILFAPGLILAQKKTHDHEKFVKKVALSLAPQLIVRWMPDDEAIAYVSERTGDPVEELKKEVLEITEQVKEDVQFINENGIYPKYDKITVNIKRNDPIKIADIVLHCEFKGDVYDITLRNCVQTDESWYLGDAVIASGDGVKDAIAKQEARKEKSQSGLLGKLASLDESEEKNDLEEADGTEMKVYEAKRFPMKGTDASSQFIKHGLIGKVLDGYYIDENYNKVTTKITYQAPEIMSDPNKYLMVGENGANGISKGNLNGFFVGGQMYVFSGEYWDILVKEGAIRQLARVVKNEETSNYVLGELVQKLDLGPENNASLMIGFKNKMSELVAENQAMSEKVKEKADGYKFKDLEQILDEYNTWYNQQNPGKVVYLLEKLEPVDKSDTQESEETEEEGTDYSSWSDTDLKKEYEIAIKKGMIGVVVDMIESDDRISANSGTLGTMPPLLLAIEFNQYKMARVLISEGANVTGTDHLGRTALHLVFGPIESEGDDHYQPILIEKLIEGGLDANVQDNKGRTALHYMAVDTNPGIIADFIEKYGADKSIANNNGETPYDVAKDYSNDPEVHKILAP